MCARSDQSPRNFLSPRLVGKRARLHELLICFAVLGGLQVFGVLALVLGPVVVAITLALIEMARQAQKPPVVTPAVETAIEEALEPRDVPADGRHQLAD